MKTVMLSVTISLLIFGCGRLDNLILVENSSDQLCLSVTVSVCDSSWTLENMVPGETSEYTAVYSRDGDFQVEVIPWNGDTLSGRFGYVTHGMTGDRVRISIEDDSINFLQHSAGY